MIGFFEKISALFKAHKKHFVMAGIAVLALSIPIVIAQVLKSQDIRQRASAGDPVTLSFSPSSGQKSIGDEFDVQILINTNTNDVSAIDGYLKYYDNILRLLSVTPGTPYTKIAIDPISYAADGGIHVGVQRIVLYNDTQQAVTGDTKILVTLRFKALANGAGPIGFGADPRDSAKSLKISASGFAGNVPVTNTTLPVMANFTVGTATTINPATPVLVTGITSATQVSAGDNHTCARLSDSTIKCWGANASGQLGNGTTTNSSTPVSVTGIATATSVSVGDGYACARLSDSTIKCWGVNVGGELGNGTTTNSSTPISVTGVTNAVNISAGYGHACARLSDSTIKCWGDNTTKQLGNTNDARSSSPVLIAGITTATEVAAGNGHTCIRLTDGTVKCLGSNLEGELGNGNTTTSSTPVSVTGITNSTQVDSANSNYARLSDGTIKAWGQNNYGQLGNGNTTNSSTPVSVTGITNATQVAAGNAHACAVLSDSTIKCWGPNDIGQLGNGASPTVPPTDTSTITPTLTRTPTITIAPTNPPINVCTASKYRSEDCACTEATQCRSGVCTGGKCVKSPKDTVPEGSTGLKLSIKIPLIGERTATVDNNPLPKNSSRIVSVDIKDRNNAPVAVDSNNNARKVSLHFDGTNYNFEGQINLGTTLETGDYLVKLSVDNSLYKLLPGIITITKGRVDNPTATIKLVTGDLNQDNKLSISDWTNMIACNENKPACTADIKALADLNDNGEIDALDVTMLQIGFGTRNGD